MRRDIVFIFHSPENERDTGVRHPMDVRIMCFSKKIPSNVMFCVLAGNENLIYFQTSPPPLLSHSISAHMKLCETRLEVGIKFIAE
jgi:hypothetical protein